MLVMALIFMNYHDELWDRAVPVKKEEVEVGDVLILGEKRVLDPVYPDVVEVRVISFNADETVTVISRVGGVESVKLSDLRRPDWWRQPYSWMSFGMKRRHYRRPLHKDEMLKHGVALVGDRGLDVGHRDFMFADFVRSMEEGLAIGRARKRKRA